MPNDKNDRNKFKLKYYLPEFIMIFTVISIIISYLLIYLIDLHNMAGLRDYLFSLNQVYFFFDYHPFVFHNWYRNGGIAEIMSWVFLGGAAVSSAFIAGRSQEKDTRVYLFWRMMAVAFIFMLIEDAGDPRHTIRSFVQGIYREPIQGTMGTITELIYFSLMAFIPFYALLRYGKVLFKSFRSLFYTIAGIIFYAIGTGLSFLGDAIDLYHNQGVILYDWVVGLGDGELAMIWQNYEAEIGWRFINYFLMDSLIEETFELLGAAAFFAAVLAFLFKDYKKIRDDG
ncbi:hypothetical protein [Natronospora cellulosivora (SeqCode)]